MAELTFFHGTMDCGKSTLALQLHYNATNAGERCLLFTMHDRLPGVISSRIGLSHDAINVTPDLDFLAHVGERLDRGEQIDELICDEAQFYNPEQIEQLACVVDEFGIDVHAFGLLTDFATRLFPGSRRLVELADRTEVMQVETRCWCGEIATHNARVIDGEIIREGAQVVVGDVGNGDDIAYVVLCRTHHREGILGSPSG